MRRNEEFVADAFVRKLGLSDKTAKIIASRLDEESLNAIAWEVKAVDEQAEYEERHRLLDIVAPGPRLPDLHVSLSHVIDTEDPTIRILRSQGYEPEIECCCSQPDCLICNARKDALAEELRHHETGVVLDSPEDLHAVLDSWGVDKGNGLIRDRIQRLARTSRRVPEPYAPLPCDECGGDLETGHQRLCKVDTAAYQIYRQQRR